MAAERHLLPAGRWHFQHGPMDIVIGAEGEPSALQSAHEAAWQRFAPLLGELVQELPLLRTPIPAAGDEAALPRPQGVVALRMWQACLPFRAQYITPMAAVAGAVAQELMACYQRPGVHKAWVNNGGDIAWHLAPGASARIGLCADIAHWPAFAQASGRAEAASLDATWTIHADWPVRGVATSGWRGRSFSLGIADSVTVLAGTSAMADAAATMVANAVNVADAAIQRQPACQLRDDTDLGALPVTVDVPMLPPERVARALHQGWQRAVQLQQQGRIGFAMLCCQGQWLHTPVPPYVSNSLAVPAPRAPELSLSMT